jgi:hypothetical protein
MAERPEQEILWGERAFGEAQRLLDGASRRPLSGLLEVGWHASSKHPLVGCFAIVATGGAFTDLIGEVLRVTYEGRSVLVYCVGSRDIDVDLSLSRRPFMAIGLLASDGLPCTVEVVA